LLIGNQQNYRRFAEMTRFGGAANLSNEPIRFVQVSDVKGIPPEVPFGTTRVNFVAGHAGDARVGVIMPRLVPPKPAAPESDDVVSKQSKDAFQRWLDRFGESGSARTEGAMDQIPIDNLSDKQEPMWCWIDVKTGKQVPTVPLAGVNVHMDSTVGAGVAVISDDRKTAFNTRTKQNFARVPCPRSY
jgi:hypothetical protein